MRSLFIIIFFFMTKLCALFSYFYSFYRFGMIPGQNNYFGCTIKIDKATRRVEPSNQAKGLVASAYLFMSEYYSISLSKSQRQLFETWNKHYPPTPWERQWANEVALIEGYENVFITHWGDKHFIEKVKVL